MTRRASAARMPAVTVSDPFGRKARPAAQEAEPDLDYLDIPAFLRRQAD